MHRKGQSFLHTRISSELDCSLVPTPMAYCLPFKEKWNNLAGGWRKRNTANDAGSHRPEFISINKRPAPGPDKTVLSLNDATLVKRCGSSAPRCFEWRESRGVNFYLPASISGPGYSRARAREWPLSDSVVNSSVGGWPRNWSSFHRFTPDRSIDRKGKDPLFCALRNSVFTQRTCVYNVFAPQSILFR